MRTPDFIQREGGACAARPGSVLGVKIKTGNDRPVSPLNPGLPLVAPTISTLSGLT